MLTIACRTTPNTGQLEVKGRFIQGQWRMMVTIHKVISKPGINLRHPTCTHKHVICMVHRFSAIPYTQRFKLVKSFTLLCYQVN